MTLIDSTDSFIRYKDTLDVIFPHNLCLLLQMSMRLMRIFLLSCGLD